MGSAAAASELQESPIAVVRRAGQLDEENALVTLREFALTFQSPQEYFDLADALEGSTLAAEHPFFADFARRMRTIGENFPR